MWKLHLEGEDRDTEDLIISGMFNTCTTLKDQPWEVVRGLMEMHRPVLGMWDEKWMDDGEVGEEGDEEDEDEDADVG